MDYKLLRKLAFEQYNKAKKVPIFERGRVNRALGIVLSNNYREQIDKYGTTLSRCHCPDSEHRQVTCKHRIAFEMNYGMWEAIQEMDAKGELVL